MKRENFDSTQIIEDYWANNHEPEVIEINFIRKFERICQQKKSQYIVLLVHMIINYN